MSAAASPARPVRSTPTAAGRRTAPRRARPSLAVLVLLSVLAALATVGCGSSRTAGGRGSSAPAAARAYTFAYALAYSGPAQRNDDAAALFDELLSQLRRAGYAIVEPDQDRRDAAAEAERNRRASLDAKARSEAQERQDRQRQCLAHCVDACARHLDRPTFDSCRRRCPSSCP